MRDKGIIFVVALLLVFAGWRFYKYEQSADFVLDAIETQDTGSVDEISSNDSSGDTSDGQPYLSGDETVIGSETDSTAPFAVIGSPTGSVVKLGSMDFTESMWVAVHANKNGALGNVLGARMFAEGTKSGDVELAVSMKAGNTYYAVLHRDAGAKTWSNENPIVTDTAGNPVQVSFVAK